MKWIIFLFALTSQGIRLSAQERIPFEASLNGFNAIPANSSPHGGYAKFYLYPDRNFVGYVRTYVEGWAATTVVIVRPTLDDPMGITVREYDSLFTTAPDEFDPGSRDYDFNGSPTSRLSDLQYAELMAGNWYINVVTPAYPNGEIRGQLIMVPEPSTIMLLAAGPMSFVILRARRVNQSS